MRGSTLVFLISLLGLDVATGSQRPVFRTVAGVVVDSVTGSGVSGAVVTIRPAAGSSRATPTVVTSTGGSFKFDGLVDGRYFIDVAAVGFVTGGYGKIFPDSEQTPLEVTASGPKAVTVKIWRLASIAGRVLVENGRPAANILVEAIQVRGSRSGGPTAAAMARTSEDGSYQLLGLAPGDYLVGVLSTFSSVSDPPVGNRSTTGPFPLMPVGQAWLQYGFVKDATVNSWLDGERLVVRPSVFYPRGPSDQAEEIAIVAGQELAGIDLLWNSEPSVTVSGRVMTEEGPAGGVSVAARVNDQKHVGLPTEVGLIATTTTKGDGSFQILGLTQGSYQIQALRLPDPRRKDPSSRSWAQIALTIGNTQADPIELRMRQPYSVCGRIEALPGSTLPAGMSRNSSISLSPIGSSRYLPSNGTDNQNRITDDGSFCIGPFLPGNYLWDVTSLGRGWTVDAIRTKEGLAIDGSLLSLSSDISEIRVQLTDRASSLDVRINPPSQQAAVVFLLPSTQTLWDNASWDSRRFQQRTVSAEGAAVFASVPSGSYLVAVRSVTDLESNWRKPEALRRLSADATPVSIGVRGATTVSVRGR